MNRTLTSKMKLEYLQILIERDNGFKCFYCMRNLLNVHWVYEHLDDNPVHSYIENIVLACQSCNVKKKDNFDMYFVALEKLVLLELLQDFILKLYNVPAVQI